jgi:nitroreductase
LENHSEIFEQIVQKRKSYRVFDPEKPISDEAIKRSLHRAILSPNSSNMQLWEFYIIKTAANKEALAKICLNQSGAKTASQLVVFVTRPDKWKERRQAMLDNLDTQFESKTAPRAKGVYYYYEKLMPMFYNTSFGFLKDILKRIIITYKGLNNPFVRDILSKDVEIVAHKSTALAAQTFMLSIAAEGFDSLPMEGFDAKRLKRLLNLPKNAGINMVVAVGTGKPEGLYGPRFRLAYDKVVFER